MIIDRLINSYEGEKVELVTRPHFFFILRNVVTGLLLLGFGAAGILYGTPLRAYLDGFLRVGSISRSGGSSGGAGTHVGTGSSGLSGIMGGTIEFVFNWAAPIAVILGLAIMAWTLLDRQLTEYAIVSSPYSGAQIYKISGVLRRQTVSVPLPVINDLKLDEPLLGRLFGWGHLGIETGNDYDGDNLVFVPNVRGFHSAYQKYRRLHFGRSDLGGLSRGAGAQAPWQR